MKHYPQQAQATQFKIGWLLRQPIDRQAKIDLFKLAITHGLYSVSTEDLARRLVERMDSGDLLLKKLFPRI